MISNIDNHEVEAWLVSQKEQLVKDLSLLVNCPSIRATAQPGKPFGQGCHDALSTYLAIATRMGFATKDHDGYCSSVYYGEGQWELGIVTHLDVVEPGDGWTYDPFSSQLVDDFIIGRGTQDNKGAAIGALYAVKYFKDHHLSPGKRLHLLAGCNEESGMGDIRYFLEHEAPPDFSIITDCGFPVCCGEKGHLTIEFSFEIKQGLIASIQGGNAINTVADYCEATLAPDLTNSTSPLAENVGTKLTAHGRSAHAAVPEQGINAIAILFEHLDCAFCWPEKLHATFQIIEKITKDTTGLYTGIKCEDSESGSLTQSAGTINLKDDLIILTLDIRYPVTADGAKLIGQIESFAVKNGIKSRILSHSLPYYINQNDPKVQYLTRIFNDLTGKETQPYTMGGGTHARVMPNSLGFGMSLPGTPTLFQAGRGLYHQPDEALHIPSLLKGIEIYIAAIAGF